MAMKIVNVASGATVRYVYVPAGSTTTINELPAGQYYLKLSFGKDWMTTTDGTRTVGKFTKETSYEQTTTLYDFGNGNSRNSDFCRLKIHVGNAPHSEKIPTKEISEQEFLDN